MPARLDNVRATAVHIAGLDGLRGIGILLVCLLHAELWSGPSGLCILFTLSGFLITGILLRRAEDFSFGDFFDRRLRRLVPALVVYLLALLILAPVHALRLKPSGGDFLFAGLFSVDIWQAFFGQYPLILQLRHLWSLGVELKFYLIWPLLLALAGRTPGRRKWLLLGLLVGVGMTWGVRFWASLEGAPPQNRWVNYIYMMRYDAIALGGMMALLVPSAVVLRRYAGVLAGVALVVLFLSPAVSRAGSQDWMMRSTVSMAASAALCLALGVAPDGIVGRWIDAPVLRHLGQWGYGIYLWHPIPIVAIHGWKILPPLLAKLLMVLASVALGALSWHLVEKRFLCRRRVAQGAGAGLTAGHRPVDSSA